MTVSSAYCLWERAKVPVSDLKNRRILAAMAAGFAVLGAYKALA